MNEPEFVYIDRDERLDEVVSACEDAPVIVLDTEFVRTNTYYPLVGLVQIYTGDECFLIDPLRPDNLSPLVDILTDADTLKVLHACSEDMEVFQHLLGVVPAPLFDTQIAGAALGVGFSVGYQSLVEHYLGIRLPKDQTRSDWLARPLSAGQLRYAALDVIHLLYVYHAQMRELEAGPKLQWVEAESAEMGRDIPTTIDPEDCYKKLKGLWQLGGRQLNTLKVLCAWREVTARRENIPRNRVVDHQALMAIARDDIADTESLREKASMMPRQVRKYGDEIMALRTQAQSTPEQEFPPPIERTDTSVDNKRLKLLREVVNEQAKRLSVAPELLTKRRHLEKLIRSRDESGCYHLPVELGGWREAAIGEALLTALADS